MTHQPFTEWCLFSLQSCVLGWIIFFFAAFFLSELVESELKAGFSICQDLTDSWIIMTESSNRPTSTLDPTKRDHDGDYLVFLKLKLILTFYLIEKKNHLSHKTQWLILYYDFILLETCYHKQFMIYVAMFIINSLMHLHPSAPL